jgi:hypothetical protein
MSFWGEFTGSWQRGKIRDAGAAQVAGYNNGIQSINDHSSSAKNYLTPYQNRGDAAYRQYTDALGVNGQDAQQSYWNTYQADPQRGYDEDRAVDAAQRRASSMGLGNSGFAAKARHRVGMEAGRSYTMDRLNRLQGLGAQGLGVANQLSNIDMNTGQQLANLYTGRGNAEAGSLIGQAGTGNTAFNNGLAIGGTLISGFTPGKSKTSPFGNMLTGMNFLG